MNYIKTITILLFSFSMIICYAEDQPKTKTISRFHIIPLSPSLVEERALIDAFGDGFELYIAELDSLNIELEDEENDPFNSGNTLAIDKPSYKKTDLEKEGLKGKVKERITYAINGAYGIRLSKQKTSVTKFNDKGNITDWIFYNPDGSISSQRYSKFDANGEEIESGFINSEGLIILKFLNTYDEKGNVIEERSYNSSGDYDGKTVIKYDTNGNYTEKCMFNATGKMINKTICEHKYDLNGNDIERNYYDKNYMFDSKVTYEYSNGFLIEEKNYNSKKVLIFKKLYTYDLYGNIKDISTMTAEGVFFQAVYTEYKYYD